MSTAISPSPSTAPSLLKAVAQVRLPLSVAESVSLWASSTSVTNAHFLSMAIEYFDTGEPMKINRLSMKPQKTATVIRLPADAGLRLARLSAERRYSPADICKQAIAKVLDSTPSELFGKDWRGYATHIADD